VAEANLQFRKANLNAPGEFLSGDVSDPFLLGRTELARADEANLRVVLLTSLGAGRRDGSKTDVELRLLDNNGRAADFKNFSLDVTVTLRAFLVNAPDQPPEVVGRFTRTVAFVDQSVATLTVNREDAPQLRPTGADAHDLAKPVQVILAVAAFPSLQTATTTVDFSS